MNYYASGQNHRSIKTVLGKTVNVCVTSTYNSNNKYRSNFCINFGYIDLQDEDCLKIEAFVLGCKQPLKEFEGEVIAIAKNKKQNKQYWIVVQKGSIYYEPQIAGILSQFLPMNQTNYICLYEKSCGAVLFTNTDGERKYLLIKNMSGHIGFPKGHIELEKTKKRQPSEKYMKKPESEYV